MVDYFAHCRSFSWFFFIFLCLSSTAEMQPELTDDDVEGLHDYAGRGDVEAQVRLGRLYQQGLGVRQDYVEAMKWYFLAAEQGDADAELSLGLMHAEGRGVPQDFSVAIDWYRRSAERGNSDAPFHLGRAYLEGFGVPQDFVSSHMWLSIAESRSTSDFRETIVELLDGLADRMTTEDVAESQRQTRQWNTAHPVDP